MSLLALLLVFSRDSFVSKCLEEWSNLAEQTPNPISGGTLITSMCNPVCSHGVEQVTTSAMLVQPAPSLWGDQGSNQSGKSRPPWTIKCLFLSCEEWISCPHY